MMTTTVSLELAKELWELGLKIETEKWWIIYDKEWECVYIESKEELADTNNYYPAYSADELVAILPARMAGVGLLKIYKLEDEYDVTYASIYPQTHSILCEALGLMCKFLLQNGFEFNGKEIVRKGEK